MQLVPLDAVFHWSWLSSYLGINHITLCLLVSTGHGYQVTWESTTLSYIFWSPLVMVIKWHGNQPHCPMSFGLHWSWLSSDMGINHIIICLLVSTGHGYQVTWESTPLSCVFWSLLVMVIKWHGNQPHCPMSFGLYWSWLSSDMGINHIVLCLLVSTSHGYQVTWESTTLSYVFWSPLVMVIKWHGNQPHCPMSFGLHWSWLSSDMGINHIVLCLLVSTGHGYQVTWESTTLSYVFWSLLVMIIKWLGNQPHCPMSFCLHWSWLSSDMGINHIVLCLLVSTGHGYQVTWESTTLSYVFWSPLVMVIKWLGNQPHNPMSFGLHWSWLSSDLGINHITLCLLVSTGHGYQVTWESTTLSYVFWSPLVMVIKWLGNQPHNPMSFGLHWSWLSSDLGINHITLCLLVSTGHGYQLTWESTTLSCVFWSLLVMVINWLGNQPHCPMSFSLYWSWLSSDMGINHITLCLLVSTGHGYQVTWESTTLSFVFWSLLVMVINWLGNQPHCPMSFSLYWSWLSSDMGINHITLCLLVSTGHGYQVTWESTTLSFVFWSPLVMVINWLGNQPYCPMSFGLYWSWLSSDLGINHIVLCLLISTGHGYQVTWESTTLSYVFWSPLVMVIKWLGNQPHCPMSFGLHWSWLSSDLQQLTALSYVFWSPLVMVINWHGNKPHCPMFFGLHWSWLSSDMGINHIVLCLFGLHWSWLSSDLGINHITLCLLVSTGYGYQVTWESTTLSYVFWSPLVMVINWLGNQPHCPVSFGLHWSWLSIDMGINHIVLCLLVSTGHGYQLTWESTTLSYVF